MPSLFFTLSRELRDQIYDIALNDCEIEPPATPADVDLGTRECKTNGIIYASTPVQFSSVWSSLILPTDRMARLLCVCRTMYAELRDRIEHCNSLEGVRKIIFELDCCMSLDDQYHLDQSNPVEDLSWWTWTIMLSFGTAVDILRITIRGYKPAELSIGSAHNHKWAFFCTCWDAVRAAKDVATLLRDSVGNCLTFERIEFYLPFLGTAEDEKAAPEMGGLWVPLRTADRIDYTAWIMALADGFVPRTESRHELGAARYSVKEHAWVMGKKLIVQLHGTESSSDDELEC